MATAARELTEETGLAIDLSYHTLSSSPSSSPPSSSIPLQLDERQQLQSLSTSLSLPSSMSCVRYLGEMHTFTTMTSNIVCRPFVGTFDWHSIATHTLSKNENSNAGNGDTNDSIPLWQMDHDEVEALIAVPLPLLRSPSLMHHNNLMSRWSTLRELGHIPFATMPQPTYLIPHTIQTADNNGLYATVMTSSSSGLKYPSTQPLVVWGLTARILQSALNAIDRTAKSAIGTL
jgi:8-oxo-dGTP pyrophosphatase MutT (NUDIX family)